MPAALIADTRHRPHVVSTAQPVTLVRWPEQRALRDDLASAGAPRLLVIPTDCPVPPVHDTLEDWIREPVGHAELSTRCATLERRFARGAQRPLVDRDGLVWFGDRWIALPESQVPIIGLLVRRFGEVVADDEIAATHVQGGSSAHPEALKATMSRVARRVGTIGLLTTRVRARGYNLHAC
jgi:hypothetical protein